MHLLILDPLGLGLDIATLAMSQGHTISHFIQDTPSTKMIGHGVVARVRGNLGEHVKKADVIFITDNAKLIPTYDRLREEYPNKVWIGPTYEQSQWESDRGKGQELLKRYDINCTPFQIFTDFDSAIAYVKKRDDRLVIKPYDSGTDKALTYVSKGAKDMVFMLERWKKIGKMPGKFMLQDFVDGVEYGVEGFFNGEEWTGEWHLNFEFKKLLNDNLGPNTGEMGTVQQVVKNSILADRLLKPLTAHLKASHYVGFFDINCIIDKSGEAWPLEITARPGWPTFNLQISLNRGDFVENLYRYKSLNFIRNRVCTGVVIASPPFPYGHIPQNEVTGIPVWGFDGDNLHHHPCELVRSKDGEWQTAGAYICTVTGHGKTVEESSKQAYENVKMLSLPNSPIYRTDIGRKLEKELPKLHKHGLATAFRYR